MKWFKIQAPLSQSERSWQGTCSALIRRWARRMHMLQSDSDVIQNANLLETYIFRLQLHHALIPLNLQKNHVTQNFSLSKRMIKVRNDPAWHTVTFQACLRGISIPVTESILFNLPQNPLCPCTNTLMHTYTMTSFFSHTAINLCLAAEIILWRNELGLLVQLQQNESMSHDCLSSSVVWMSVVNTSKSKYLNVSKLQQWQGWWRGMGVKGTEYTVSFLLFQFC